MLYSYSYLVYKFKLVMERLIGSIGVQIGKMILIFDSNSDSFRVR